MRRHPKQTVMACPTPKMGVKEEPPGAGSVSAVGARNNTSLKNVLARGQEKKEHLEKNLDLAHGC